MNQTIFNLADINTNTLSFGKKKDLSNGSSVVELLYQGSPLWFRLPALEMPFAISDYKGNQKFKLTLNLSENVPELHAVLEQLSEWLVNTMSLPENSILLGGSKTKPLSQVVIESKCQPVVKSSKSTTFPPHISINVAGAKSHFFADFYDQRGKPLAVDSTNISKVVPVRSMVSTLVQPSIWINNTAGCGISFSLKQAKVCPSVLEKVCLIEDP